MDTKGIKFQFLVPKTYLVSPWDKIDHPVYMDVIYSQIGETNFVNVFYFGVAPAIINYINFCQDMQDEVNEAAKNNLQSQLEPKPIYEIKPF